MYGCSEQIKWSSQVGDVHNVNLTCCHITGIEALMTKSPEPCSDMYAYYCTLIGDSAQWSFTYQYVPQYFFLEKLQVVCQLTVE